MVVQQSCSLLVKVQILVSPSPPSFAPSPSPPPPAVLQGGDPAVLQGAGLRGEEEGVAKFNKSSYYGFRPVPPSPPLIPRPPPALQYCRGGEGG